MTNFERATGRMNRRHATIASDAANRIDTIIAVFALGVMFGMWIA